MADGIEADIASFLDNDEDVTNAITAYVQEKDSYAKKEASITRRQGQLETRLSEWFNEEKELDDDDLQSLYDNILKIELYAQYYFVEITPKDELEGWSELIGAL